MPNQSPAHQPQEHRLSFSEILGFLQEDGWISAATAATCQTEYRVQGSKQHPLIALGEAQLRHGNRLLTVEVLTEWLARRCGLDYFHIDPLKIDFSGVGDVMSSAYAARFSILPVRVTASEVVIATAEPFLREWEAELKQILRKDIQPAALGSLAQSNERKIYKYIHPLGVKSCQLVMGMTALETGSMWNTMPTHTHERRMEVYFYFNMPEDSVVFHMMGQPQETRHLVIRNEQAAISPSWSIHSGVGTVNYTFIWGMAGENQTFDDMDHVPMSVLK